MDEKDLAFARGKAVMAETSSSDSGFYWDSGLEVRPARLAAAINTAKCENSAATSWQSFSNTTSSKIPPVRGEQKQSSLV
jgi:hypothetical protein